MANVPAFIDVIRGVIVALPEFSATGLSMKDINRQYLPQVKDRRPEDYPAISIMYDFDKRARWAPIDKVHLFLTIEMKAFDDTQTLSEAMRAALDQYQTYDAASGLVIYKMFHDGGGNQPMYIVSRSTYQSVLEFECELG